MKNGKQVSTLGVLYGNLDQFVTLHCHFLYSSLVLSLPTHCTQVFDNYAVTVMIGGEPYTLGLFDTAGMLRFNQP